MTDDRGGFATRPYPVDLLRQLYPGRPVTVSRSPRPSTRYLVLPALGRPRAIVPAGRRRAAARALHRQLSGNGRRRAMSRGAAVLAAASGVADLMAPTLSVEGPPGGVAAGVLSDVLHRDDLFLAMPVSPPRANRKPVVQVMDPAGRVLAFAKVGHDDLTRALVRREAQALQRVGKLSYGSLVVPDVLGLREWSGLSVLVLSAVEVRRHRLSPRESELALRRTTAAVVACGDPEVVDLAASEHVHRLREDLARSGLLGQHLLPVVEELTMRLGAAAVGGWHGDLNPGNVALAQGPSTVWDWERFEQSAPEGFDLLHHHFTSATHSGTSAGRAAADLVAHAGTLLESTREDRGRDLARLYLVTLGARYLVDRQDVAGAADGDVAQWLLPALARSR